MKKEVDTRLIIAVIAVVLITVGVFGWRMLAPRGGGSNNLTPKEAGLGKPVYPAGGQPQTPGNTQ